MITTNERQEKLIDEFGNLINPSKARILRDAGLGVVESRKEGAYVWDQSDTRYIDCRENMSLFNIGRRNPDVIKALNAALEECDLGNTLFFSEARVQLAKKLGKISPGGKLTGVAFGVSGGEIVDFAIKLARATTGRKKVVAMKNAYHGCTGFALSGTDSSELKDPFKPIVPDFKHVPFGDIKALTNVMDDSTAAVLVEPIQGHAGVIVPSEGYLKAVRKLCDQWGALLIVDEIQTGLGRTGKMFACEHYGVIPDIMTLGKSLSGGIYPITAAVFKRKLLQFWNDHPFSHLSSFGGSDLGCLVALAAIEYTEKNLLAERAAELAKIFSKGFAELVERYPRQIKEFRQKGLLMAIEFVDKSVALQMCRDLTQQGLLPSFNYSAPEKMRIMPSLTITEDDAHTIVDAFDKALAGFKYVSGETTPEVASMLEGLH